MNVRKISLMFVGILVVSFAAFLSITRVAEGTSHSNVFGWLWGGSTDENLGYAPTLNNATGLGWASLSSDNPETAADELQYGLSIDGSQNIHGSVWSSNLGWIQFDPSGPYPASPDHAAKKEGSTFTGWARFTSIETALNNTDFPPTSTCDKGGNSGCWEGWIKLSGTAGNGSSYGVSIDAANKVSGYGWSNELGWIAFKGSNTPVNPPEDCGNGLDDDGDGFDDLSDTDCHEIGIECADGNDNDGDGKTDGADTDCPSGNTISASCSASPTAPEIDDVVMVTWSATVFSGGPNLSYAWELHEEAASVTGSGSSVTATYTSEGVKTAEVTITNPSTSATVDCEVQVRDELNEDEVDPFFPFF